MAGLCFRCEHRAEYLETGRQYRCECGTTNMQVWGCYMYKPTKPVVTKIVPGYKKCLRFAPAFIAARERAEEILDGQLHLADLGKGKACLYWMPKEEQNAIRTKRKNRRKVTRQKANRRRSKKSS